MKKIITFMLGDDEVSLKKGFLGWKVVHPVVKNGKIHWKNLLTGGSWWNLVILGFIILMILGLLWEYSHNMQVLQEQANFCKLIIQ